MEYYICTKQVTGALCLPKCRLYINSLHVVTASVQKNPAPASGKQENSSGCCIQTLTCSHCFNNLKTLLSWIFNFKLNLYYFICHCQKERMKQLTIEVYKLRKGRNNTNMNLPLIEFATDSPSFLIRLENIDQIVFYAVSATYQPYNGGQRRTITR